MPLLDGMVNWPVWSVYILPVMGMHPGNTCLHRGRDFGSWVRAVGTGVGDVVDSTINRGGDWIFGGGDVGTGAMETSSSSMRVGYDDGEEVR